MEQPLSIRFTLCSSVYRVSLQGLKRPVVQQKVGACCGSTCYQMNVSYVISRDFSLSDLSNKKCGVDPITGFGDFN